MRISKREPPPIPGVDMTSMIDVVFLLIVFFMLVSQISEVKRSKVELPSVESENEPESSLLVINLDTDGKIMFGGKNISLDQLATLLSDEADADGNFGSVILRADERCDSAHVNRIVVRLHELGAKVLRIAVQDPA